MSDWDEDEMVEPPLSARKPVFLTAREEVALCQKAQQGCQAARDAMVEANIRLVTSIAKKYHGKSLVFEDLVQEGVIGLLLAVDKFDPSRGTRFTTFATPWIKQTIGRSLERHDRIIRLPIHAHEVARHARRAEDRLYGRTGRQPSREEVVIEAEMDENTARTYYRLTEDAVSIDWAEDSDSSAIIDFVSDEERESPMERVLRGEWEGQIQAFLERLTPQQQWLIKERFGFNGYPKGHAEIAKDMGGTRQGWQNLEKRAIQRLRSMMEAEGFTGIDER